MKHIYFLIALSLCFTPLMAKKHAKESELLKHYEAISLKPFNDSIAHARTSFKDNKPPYAIYDDTQIVGIAENMLALQNPDGGWKKNYDWAKINSKSELEALKESVKNVEAITYEKPKNHEQSTLDNRNIYSQIAYLAQVYRQKKDKRYITCINNALTWIFNAQHPTSGGFSGADVMAITYNDDVMAGVLGLLLDVATNDDLYGFLPKDKREEALNAYNRGVSCILKTQIKVTTANGDTILTAWGQQHDHETLEPIWARAFEPPSITACESCSILKLLMKDPNPTPQIKQAINSALAFLQDDNIIIHGKKIIRQKAAPEISSAGKYTDYEQIMVDDSDAKDLWARFYDLKTMQPIWCDRGQKFCATFNDMSKERRNGYAYTGTWPLSCIKEYEAWKQKWGD